MFPKKTWKKKRKKHKKSILHEKDGTCYLCMKLYGNDRIYPMVHEHHVYEGALRSISEAEGFKVYLCPGHHVFGPEASHNKTEYLKMIQKDCQEVYERTHSRQEFRKLTGRSYIED